MIAVMDRDDNIGKCTVHKVSVVDRSCLQCDEEWRCNACGEVRYDDYRVGIGRYCMICTYENKGGE